jgi:hypothetical protein
MEIISTTKPTPTAAALVAFSFIMNLFVSFWLMLAEAAGQQRPATLLLQIEG